MNIIYQTGKKYLGKDIALTQQELGCSEAVNYIFKQAIGKEIGGDYSTYRMYLCLKKDERFEKVASPAKGDIIISPTGFGKGNGHVGIMSDGNKIMSNNSYTFLWDEHLDLITWKKFFASFPIEFYRYKYGELPEPVYPPLKEPEKEVKINLEKQITILQRVVALYKQIIGLIK
jgi:hypothetical protein